MTVNPSSVQMGRTGHGAVAAATAVLIVAAAAGYGWWQLDRRLDQHDATVARLKRQLTQAEGRLNRIEGDISGVANYLASLEPAPDVSGDIARLHREIAELVDQGDTLTSDLDELRSCVNQYMDTIAVWSSNVYSYFTYQYC